MRQEDIKIGHVYAVRNPEYTNSPHLVVVTDKIENTQTRERKTKLQGVVVKKYTRYKFRIRNVDLIDLIQSCSKYCKMYEQRDISVRGILEHVADSEQDLAVIYKEEIDRREAKRVRSEMISCIAESIAGFFDHVRGVDSWFCKPDQVAIKITDLEGIAPLTYAITYLQEKMNEYIQANPTAYSLDTKKLEEAFDA